MFQGWREHQKGTDQGQVTYITTGRAPWITILYRIIASLHRYRADRKLTNPITVTLFDFKYDYVFYQTKNDTTNTSPSHDLDREMDLFVLIMSILVPVSSPLIGIAVDTVHKRTKDSTKTMLTGCTVIYSALIVYSLAVFVNTNVGRWCSYSLLSIAKSFGLWGCTMWSSVSILLSSAQPLTKSVQR